VYELRAIKLNDKDLKNSVRGKKVLRIRGDKGDMEI